MVEVKVLIDDKEKFFEVESNSTFAEISKQVQEECEFPLILGLVNNRIVELSSEVERDTTIRFLDITNQDAYRAYQRSVSYLMIYAIKKVYGEKAKVLIEHSINKNFYCEVPDLEVDDDFIKNVTEKMLEMVDADEEILKLTVSRQKGVEIFNQLGMDSRADSLKFIRNSNISMYRMDAFYDYLYGPMVPSAGSLGKFNLVKYGEGFLIQFPMRNNPNEFNEVKNLAKISQVFIESSRWARILNVDTVGQLNNAICNGRIKDIILISEALHEKKIAKIADMITNQKKNIVLIAGPSSSGKTTFANRICIQLKVNGLKPYIISLDDYYLDREHCPVGDDGKANFEALEAIDIKQFSNDVNALLRGETIQLPKFNFKTGKREYNGNFIKLNNDEVLVIEGIHGLNGKLTENIPAENKFKIYVSALTQLNIDEHNRIPTTDTRLIRRLVRDFNFRGFDALSTFDIWPSVVKGESINIFPYQEEADATFNSALVYELCVLKQFVEPLLFGIEREQPHYIEANRLIRFMDSFLNVNCKEVIPPNSIIREFIGGSCFNV